MLRPVDKVSPFKIGLLAIALSFAHACCNGSLLNCKGGGASPTHRGGRFREMMFRYSSSRMRTNIQGRSFGMEADFFAHTPGRLHVSEWH